VAHSHRPRPDKGRRERDALNSQLSGEQAKRENSLKARSILRKAAYRSGLLRARHRARHSDALTVAMFHRVMDPADPNFEGADRTYTVSIDVFEAVLDFFQLHYAVVSLDDVLNASQGRRRLPAFPLLITFDDGWRDNLLFGAPILARHGLPGVVFAAAEPLTSSTDVWWQEAVFSAARRGKLADALSCARSKWPPGRPALEDDCSDALSIVCRLASLSQAERDLFLSCIEIEPAMCRMMLAKDDLPALMRYGVVVGVHGFSHLPLTRIADVASELGRARDVIQSLTGDGQSASAMACPHGAYDSRVLEAAYTVGYKLVFSSDPVLIAARHGFIDARRPLGRINMIEAHLVDSSGHPDPAAMATWLWHRNCDRDRSAS